MKITKRQLRRIIKEEKAKLVETGFGSMEPFAPDYDTRDPLDDFDPIQLSYTNPQTGEAVSKPLYSTGEADDAFELMFSIDPNIKYSVDDIREGKRNIKITKRQLKRIIKEEKRKLREAYPIGGGETSPQWEAFKDAAYEVAAGFIDAGMEADGIQSAMQDEIAQMIREMINTEPEWDEESSSATSDMASKVWR